MTREEHIENLKAIASDMPSDKCADWIESLMAGVKALEQEPCDDYINRRAVYKILNDAYFLKLDDGAALQESVKQLPSVTPQPKMGRWVKTIGENGVTSAIRCSECGFEDNRYELFDYCPVCGAKMQEMEI